MSNTETINPEDDFGAVDSLGQDDSLIGTTSQETTDAGSSLDKNENGSFLKRLFSNINLFDAMLLVSFVLITLSTFYLVYAMVYHYQGWPWNRPWDVEL